MIEWSVVMNSRFRHSGKEFIQMGEKTLKGKEIGKRYLPEKRRKVRRKIYRKGRLPQGKALLTHFRESSQLAG